METQTVQIYVVQFGDNNIFKIGISSDPNRRLIDMQTASPYLLSIIYIAEFEDRERAQTMEHLFHNWFKNKQMYGEWFEVKSGEIVEAWDHVSKALTALGASVPELVKVGNVSKPALVIKKDTTRGTSTLAIEDALDLLRRNIDVITPRKSAPAICEKLNIEDKSLRTVQRALKEMRDNNEIE